MIKGDSVQVISGKYKGRKLIGFTLTKTRPTMDRVKESLFAMIQTKLKDSVVLDLFAGTGGLGIEALSNGALKCYFVDKEKDAINVIKKNTQEITNCYIYELDALKALDMFKEKNITFDIIILDPPYHEQLLNKVLQKIIDLKLLNDDGIIVCEYEEEEITVNITCLKHKKYGSKNVKICKE